jgi:hypothetical protein
MSRGRELVSGFSSPPPCEHQLNPTAERTGYEHGPEAGGLGPQSCLAQPYEALFVLITEARDAALMQLRIDDRAAFRAHPRLTECAVGVDQPDIAMALDDILPCRPVRGRVFDIGLRPVRHQLSAFRRLIPGFRLRRDGRRRLISGLGLRRCSRIPAGIVGLGGRIGGLRAGRGGLRARMRSAFDASARPSRIRPTVPHRALQIRKSACAKPR